MRQQRLSIAAVKPLDGPHLLLRRYGCLGKPLVLVLRTHSSGRSGSRQQPHSIKIGNTWISHRWLGPLSPLMSASADLGMVGANYERYDDMKAQLVYTFAGALLDQSFFSGAINVFGALQDLQRGQISGSGERQVLQITKSLVPSAGALGALNRVLAPGLREYDTAWQQELANVVPG